MSIPLTIRSESECPWPPSRDVERRAGEPGPSHRDVGLGELASLTMHRRRGVGESPDALRRQT